MMMSQAHASPSTAPLSLTFDAHQQKASRVDINAQPWLSGGPDRTTNLSDVSGPVGMMMNGVAVYR